MTLQQLDYILALDRFRHFVSAAQHCFVTQPTLTIQVKKLEEEIGITLFDRTQHPLKPTPEGEKILYKAKQIMREVEQLKEMVSTDRTSIEGTFKIGIIPTIAPYIVPQFIGEFTSKYPNTHLIFDELKSEDIIQKLNENSLDMGILATPLEERNLREIPLYYEPFEVFASENHPFFNRDNIDQHELNDATGLFLMNQGHCFRNQTMNLCRKSAAAPVSYESGSIETLRNLVLHNEGYTLLPKLALQHAPQQGIPITNPTPAREVSLVVHNGFTKEMLVETIRESILDLVPNDFVKNEQYIRVKWR